MVVTIEDLRPESRRNRGAFERVALVPRVLAGVQDVDLSTTVLGQRLAAPLLLAPTGLCGMATSRGEIPSAAAATAAGAVARDLLERPAAAGYRTLVVTVDTPVLGRRERDLRNGATIPPRITLR